MTLGSPIASVSSVTASAAGHAAYAGPRSCCNLKPYHPSAKRGGALNSTLPGAKSTIHNKRRVIFGDKKPHKRGDPSFFPIITATPLLDGTGSGLVRAWVVGSQRGGKKDRRYKVQVNWGQRKQMPPPKNVPNPLPAYSKSKIWYFYVFSVTVRRTPAPPPATDPTQGPTASGWIPADCIKNSSKWNYRAFLHKLGRCMKRYDQRGARALVRHARPKKATHHLVCTPPSHLKVLNKRYYTHVHGGTAGHYRNRTPDSVSPCGYINVCYNLPDLNDSRKQNAGGVSCDTFPVGTPFYRIKKAKGVKAKLEVGSQLIKVVNGKDRKASKQRFVYGALPYIEHGNTVRYTYGWVDIGALDPGVGGPSSCSIEGKSGAVPCASIPAILLNPP